MLLAVFSALLFGCLSSGYSSNIGDEFEFFNSSKWNVVVTGSPYNNELQYYRDNDKNYRVENGALIITPLKQSYNGKDYTSARLYSNFSWKYGRVEVKAKLPSGFGLWPAIWMMSKDEKYGGWPQSGEIDIIEARGQDLDHIASTIHYGKQCTSSCDEHFMKSSGDLKLECSVDDWHVYSLDWTPTELVYKIDDNAYYRHNIDRNISYMYSEKGQPFDQEFYLILNVAVGGDYLDNPKPETKWEYPDAEMWVDYVRVKPLQEIATLKCRAKSDADANDICGSALWACTSQNFADVTSKCTVEFYRCCNNVSACEYNKLNELVSEVYEEYDKRINNDASCDFSGTAARKYVLNDGNEVNSGNCRVKENAKADNICGSLRWACKNQNHVDVTDACSKANYALSCCPNSCNYDDLKNQAEVVFQSYYSQDRRSTSCDFSGTCQLEGIQCKNDGSWKELQNVKNDSNNLYKRISSIVFNFLNVFKFLFNWSK